MNQARLGYNAKARGSVAGGKKKGKRRTQAAPLISGQADPNACIHVPKSMDEKEAERREKVKQEVYALRPYTSIISPINK